MEGSLGRLPNEILCKIFGYLSGFDACRLMMISRAAATLIDERLWQDYVENFIRRQSTDSCVREWPTSRKLQIQERDASLQAVSRQTQEEQLRRYDEFQQHASELDRLIEADMKGRIDILPPGRTWRWVFQAVTRQLPTLGPVPLEDDPIGDSLVITGYRDVFNTDGTWIMRAAGTWHGRLIQNGGVLWTQHYLYVGDLETFQGRRGSERLPIYRRSGTGRHRGVGGQVYHGEYDCGVEHGVGTKSWFSGGTYEGHFENSLENGYGLHTWQDGGKYLGQWRDGFQEGEGIYLWKQGNYFVGEWSHGNPVDGRFVWTDGRYYDGHFETRAVKSGIGEYIFEDGSVYSGNWSNNVREGYGRMKWANGKFFEGNWRGDSRVETTRSDLANPLADRMPYDGYFSEPIEQWEVYYSKEVKQREQAVLERLNGNGLLSGNHWPFFTLPNPMM